jgi:hypothetical protein
MTDWQEQKTFALERINDQGVWEIRLDSGRINHADQYRLRMHWAGAAVTESRPMPGGLFRIPKP